VASRVEFICKQIPAALVLYAFIGPGAGRLQAEEYTVAGIGHGTTAVVLLSPKSIYAAVDSKLTYQEYRDGKLRVTNTLLCKMKPVGPYYSVVAGVVRGTNGYDAQEEIAKAYAPGRGIAEMMAALQTQVPEKLLPMFQTMRDIDPAAFDSNIAGNELQVALMGMEINAPKVGLVEFLAIDDNGKVGLTVRLSSCPGNCETPTTGYLLGSHEAIEASMRRDSSVLNHPTEEEIDQLMQLEFASHPDVVGGPIAMVRISAAGSSVLRAGACAADAAASGTSSVPLAETGNPKAASQPSKPGKAEGWIQSTRN
jgi:hypothetical protein